MDSANGGGANVRFNPSGESRNHIFRIRNRIFCILNCKKNTLLRFCTRYKRLEPPIVPLEWMKVLKTLETDKDISIGCPKDECGSDRFGSLIARYIRQAL